MSTFRTHIELEVSVDYTFSKGMKGTRDRYGVPEEPDDPDEIEITEVEAVGKPGDISNLLTKEQLDQIEQEAWDHLEDREP